MADSEQLSSRLKLQRLFVENILGAIADGVMVIDRQGEVVFANQALASILGIPVQELMSKSWGQLFMDEPRNQDFSQTVIEVIQTRQMNLNSQVHYLAPDGSQRELIATTSLIREGQDDVLGVVAVFKDVTEIKALHQREQELLGRERRLYEERREGLERMARAVAHEIRNPVMAIGGLAKRLLEQAESSGSEGCKPSYLIRIVEASHQLEDMVKLVHEYATLRTPHFEVVDLPAWLSQETGRHRPRAESQGVKIKLSVFDTPKASMDENLLNRALDYILENSLDAMKDGGELDISLDPGEREHVITIKDNGPGIPPEDLPFIFDPFFTSKANAVGMSLALAKRIISDHQGRLEIKSPAGQGVTVTIGLPVSQPV